MAFFSLMVLMLFAIVHQPEASTPDSLAISSSSASETEEEINPQIILFHKDGYFNETLAMINPNDLDPAKPVLLAIQDGIDISDVMAFKQSYSKFKIQISALPQNLDAAISAKRN